MVARVEQGDGSIVYAAEDAVGSIRRLASGVVLMFLVGKGRTEVDRGVIGEFSREIAHSGRLSIFADLRELSAVAIETREFAAEWGRHHKGRFEVHLLVSSKLVEMAVSIISMMMGMSFTLYSNEVKFVEAIHHKVPTFVSLPGAPRVDSQRASDRSTA